MAEVFVFADEAGTLVFSPKTSRYFILTTVTVPDCSVGDALLKLRRQLAWEGIETHPEFRASEEQQLVRDRVFEVLRGLRFRIDATIFDKPKLWPANRTPETGFYHFAWVYHFKYLANWVRSFGSPSGGRAPIPASGWRTTVAGRSNESGSTSGKGSRIADPTSSSARRSAPSSTSSKLGRFYDPPKKKAAG